MQLSKKTLEVRLAAVTRQMVDAQRIVDQTTGAKKVLEMLIREIDEPDSVSLGANLAEVVAFNERKAKVEGIN